MRSVFFDVIYIECRYGECSYAECRYAECRYAKCHYAEYHYAECRYGDCPGAKEGAKILCPKCRRNDCLYKVFFIWSKKLKKIMTDRHFFSFVFSHLLKDILWQLH